MTRPLHACVCVLSTVPQVCSSSERSSVLSYDPVTHERSGKGGVSVYLSSGVFVSEVGLGTEYRFVRFDRTLTKSGRLEVRPDPVRNCGPGLVGRGPRRRSFRGKGVPSRSRTAAENSGNDKGVPRRTNLERNLEEEVLERSVSVPYW